jgi:hypothetical protein
MSISIGGVETPGETGTFGVFEIVLNHVGISGSGTSGGDMEFVLESLNNQTTEATGHFMFVSHSLETIPDARRWAVKGSFTLRNN